jgi:hypothetical protein
MDQRKALDCVDSHRRQKSAMANAVPARVSRISAREWCAEFSLESGDTVQAPPGKVVFDDGFFAATVRTDPCELVSVVVSGRCPASTSFHEAAQLTP